MKLAKEFLDYLNKEYYKLHKAYEDLFWVSYMGDHSVDKRKDTALKTLNGFRTNSKLAGQVNEFMKSAGAAEKKRLALWQNFFTSYQTPPEAVAVHHKIIKLESAIHKKRAARKEGYIDPYTKKFVVASSSKIRTMMGTNSDEKVRRACFDAYEKLSLLLVKEYIQLVGLRNEYARKLGYADFYDFKVQREDGMTKKELFGIFDEIYQKTKYAQKNIRKLEKKMPSLRKPWNFGYMMAGDFTKEEDPYFQFDDALERWGRSFAALGIDFKGGTLQLDLLDRKGKYNNGFCHWPDPVRFQGNQRMPGHSNFTCNVVPDQVGSGSQGIHTLFHEGGHAAHYLNVTERDICVATEYSPATASWAETQSMFLDTVFSSVEWRTRYAANAKGKSYPFDLFERRARKLHLLRPLGLNGIMFVCDFEKEIYEAKDLDSKKVIALAQKSFTKYYDQTEDSVNVLGVPHIYSEDNACGYHGYGLAELALEQWREYFYKKYGYIVDNPNVGKEMARVWQLGSSKTFSELVVMATGKKLSAEPILRSITMALPDILKKAKTKIERMRSVPMRTKPINLNAKIRMVDGKNVIADNKKSFEAMAAAYKKWLKTKHS